MAQTFNEITRNVVDRFLQNILFIDDNAYQTEKKINAFDANEISSIFAQKGKLCTIFAPATTEDLGFCKTLFSKSDVVVLDWYLNIENTQQIADAEADVEAEEPRGIYTLELIKNIVEDATEKKLKLIIVYTGDGAKLYGITKDIHEAIATDANYTIDEKRCQVSSANVTILVRAKDNGEKDQLKYNQDLQSKIVKYEDLPDFITAEFARFVGGLLPNFAMSTIASIRNNTSNIIGVFSKDIDPAFLGHYVSIPDCNDAISMLPKIFGTAVANLIEDEELPFKEWILAWVKTRENNNVTIHDEEIEIKTDKLLEFVESTKSFKKKLKNSFGINIEYNEYEKEDAYKKNSIKMFTEDGFDLSNYKWAKLVQHSNLFSSPKNHRLTTGTIIKYKAEEEDKWKYLICIQQSCDSVRISEKERPFLFLPLVQGIKGEAVVVGEQDHLIVDNKSYSIKLHRFSPNKNNANITAELKENGEYVFEDTDGKKFVWVAELKELFAQHIVSAYASQLSRVGIDNSEWIRLIGKTK